MAVTRQPAPPHSMEPQSHGVPRQARNSSTGRTSGLIRKKSARPTEATAAAATRTTESRTTHLCLSRFIRWLEAIRYLQALGLGKSRASDYDLKGPVFQPPNVTPKSVRRGGDKRLRATANDYKSKSTHDLNFRIADVGDEATVVLVVRFSRKIRESFHHDYPAILGGIIYEGKNTVSLGDLCGRFEQGLGHAQPLRHVDRKSETVLYGSNGGLDALLERDRSSSERVIPVKERIGPREWRGVASFKARFAGRSAP